ncbi:hypothetical protein A9Q84_04750 [Halobacteriovorax marinus]|uniref:Uncharacterized protein n=1 Tax=Halobacteriovorax marinus TaxID=97084 RepID=A0A1Y5FAU1_9BACT|nr:hypothetical protein A9Q84_04750 [Halobacteriovorax marinus]
MKNLLTIIFALFLSTSALAEVSTSVAVTSDYVWRGQTQTDHGVAVQGTLDYSWKFLTVGTWLSNVTSGSGNTEIDLYVSAKHEFSKNFSASFGITNYTYKNLPTNNTMEYALTLESKIANLFIGYTDDYFAADSSSVYYQLTRSFSISKKDNLGLSLALGMTTFDSEVKVGSTDYLDYKVGITKSVNNFEYEFFYTDTNRKDKTATTETETKDSSFGVSLAIAI